MTQNYLASVQTLLFRHTFTILFQTLVSSETIDQRLLNTCGTTVRAPRTLENNKIRKNQKKSDNSQQSPNISTSNITPRIINGQQALENSLPWMVYMNCCSESGQACNICGGVLVTDRHILTAAHCFLYTESYKVQVFLGAFKKPKSTDPHILVTSAIPGQGEIFIQHNFDTYTFMYDLAIVMTNVPVPSFTNSIRPICLPDYTQFIPDDSDVIVSGFGVMEYNNGGSTPTYLQQVHIKTISNKICTSPDWYGSFVNTEIQICAGLEEGGKDACQGDSGAPLVYFDEVYGRWFLVGIVSSGEECAKAKRPGIYTRVQIFRYWIDDVVSLTSGVSLPTGYEILQTPVYQIINAGIIGSSGRCTLSVFYLFVLFMNTILQF